MKNLLLLLFLLPCFALAGFKTTAQLSGTATTSSAKVLDKQNYRVYLLCLNKGASDLLIKMGSAHSGTEGIVVPAGGNYEPHMPPNEAIYLKAASGSVDFYCVEGVGSSK